jgi:hypothetical protein
MDQEGAPTQESESTAQDAQNGHAELTLGERADLEVFGIFQRRGMITDGSVDLYAIADEIEPTILAAIVEVEKDRSKVGITPTRTMELHFSEVPKRSEVDSTDVELMELTDLVYGKVKAQAFRCLNVMPDGPIQQRLAENGGGMVLCRMKGKRGQEEVAYITRNRKCIHQDNNGPALHRAELAMQRASRLTDLSIDRVPEHGKWFRNNQRRTLQASLKAADDSAIAALNSGEEPDDASPDEDGDE